MNDLMKIEFEGAEVRVIHQPDGPWFVAADVCNSVGIRNSRTALRQLDDDEKGVANIYTPGGMQEVTIISESALYTMLNRSSKPLAKRFRRWVNREVLPCIRQHGCYPAPEVTYDNRSIVINDEKEFCRQFGLALAEAVKTGLAPIQSDVVEMKQGLSNVETKLIDYGTQLTDCNQRLTAIEDSVGKGRKDLAEKTKRNHLQAVRHFYNGRCPCCQQTLIINSSQPPTKLNTLQYDHWVNKSDNREASTWPVCATCNSNLRDAEYKHKTALHHFLSYQNRLQEVERVVYGRKDLPFQDGGSYGVSNG